jgi:hypothetical protein
VFPVLAWTWVAGVSILGLTYLLNTTFHPHTTDSSPLVLDALFIWFYLGVAVGMTWGEL